MTASKTALGWAPCATSVATRRSAACSSASRATSARASAFAIAVAIRSVNWPMRDSVSAGSEVFSVLAATMAPHSRPSTTIGVPTAARTPAAARASAIGPLASP